MLASFSWKPFAHLTHTHTENVCMPVLRKNIKILIYCISRINNVIPNNKIDSYRQVNTGHTTSDIFSIESSKSMFCQGFFSFVILVFCSSTVAFSLNSMWNNLWVVLISAEHSQTQLCAVYWMGVYKKFVCSLLLCSSICLLILNSYVYIVLQYQIPWKQGFQPEDNEKSWIEVIEHPMSVI